MISIKLSKTWWERRRVAQTLSALSSHIENLKSSRVFLIRITFDQILSVGWVSFSWFSFILRTKSLYTQPWTLFRTEISVQNTLKSWNFHIELLKKVLKIPFFRGKSKQNNFYILSSELWNKVYFGVLRFIKLYVDIKLSLVLLMESGNEASGHGF